ncbi:gem (nuclear organelle) associated protein 2 [Tyrophagus putrescentiae]|nr:gem (nuclear organelle) associated protein 2 [Tyrophagus putrescentiae]
MSYVEVDDYESSSDDEGFEMMRKPVLPVADFTEYDPSVPPQTGAEYLRRVQLEAKKEPKFKVASNLADIRCRTLAVGSGNHLFTSEELDSDEFIPSKPQFRLSQSATSQVISTFNSLREEVKCRRAEHNEKIDLRRPKKWWKNYCLVRKEAEETDEQQGGDMPAKRTLNSSYQPTATWIEEEFTVGHGLWVYSLLATLDTDVQTGDVYSLLREIARLCSRIRHRIEMKIEGEVENVNDDGDNQIDLQQISSLSTIILLVGRCFGQKDLLDDQ